jgi:hypothetical protein
MARPIEIIDPEGELTRRRRRRVILAAGLLSLCLFGYPVAEEYSTKWRALNAARRLAMYLSDLKSHAILKKMPISARFHPTGLIEVDEVSSCGPVARRTKLWEARLSDLEPGVDFAPEAWVRSQTDTREAFLSQFCYDPFFGSSIHASGLAHGAIFLVHHDDYTRNRGERLVQVLVEGPSAELSFE